MATANSTADHNERAVTELHPTHSTECGHPQPTDNQVVSNSSLRFSSYQNNRIPNVCIGNPPVKKEVSPSDSLDRKLDLILNRLMELERGHDALIQAHQTLASSTESFVSAEDVLDSRLTNEELLSGKSPSDDKLHDAESHGADQLIVEQYGLQQNEDNRDEDALDSEASKSESLEREAAEAVLQSRLWKEKADHLEIEKLLLLDQLHEAKLREEKALEQVAIAAQQRVTETVTAQHPMVVALNNSIRAEAIVKERELRLEIEQLRIRNAELEHAPVRAADDRITEQFAMEMESLRLELVDLRNAHSELQYRNNELTKRLQESGDKKPDIANIDSNAMSWEEQKKAWLEQLEEEDDQFDSANQKRVLEIKKVIESTTEELNWRDREISELRNLLTEQTVATQGLAVGATAIAAQLDLDDLIREERIRLETLQTEWEQKQRQGEIEMSLERAKLARERLELQETMRNLEAIQNDCQYARGTSQADTVVDDKPRGRWLQRLGLRDN